MRIKVYSSPTLYTNFFHGNHQQVLIHTMYVILQTVKSLTTPPLQYSLPTGEIKVKLPVPLNLLT